MIKYTAEQKRWLNDNIPNRHNFELIERFKKEFGIELSVNQVKGYKRRNKLISGFKGSEGMPPPNKDRKMTKEVYDKCKATMFKKGQVPKNHRPVGSKRVNVEGYTEVKVKEPDVWRMEHRLIYENHYGKIPEGTVITFLDGDKTNMDISNLKAISLRVNGCLAKNNLRYNSKELTEAGIKVAEIKVKVSDLKNKKNKKMLTNANYFYMS